MKNAKSKEGRKPTTAPNKTDMTKTPTSAWTEPRVRAIRRAMATRAGIRAGEDYQNPDAS